MKSQPELFDFTFFFQFPNGYTTYDYDYAAPQKYTIVKVP